MKYFTQLSFFVIIVIMSCCQCLKAQDSTNQYNEISKFQEKLFNDLNDKTTSINKRLEKQTDKYLQRMAKEESRLYKKLTGIDSSAAEKIFGASISQYDRLQQNIKNAGGKVSSSQQTYFSHIDSLQTALKLLDQTGTFQAKTADINKTLNNIQSLQNKFSKAEEINRYLHQRSQQLQQSLAKYGLTNELKNIKQQVYYYQAQLAEYKQTFDTPSKLESKALAVLQKSALFKKFFLQHSQLAGLFRMPGTDPVNSLASFAGLQTRDVVQQQIMQKFGSLPDLQQLTSHQVNAAREQLGRLKNMLGKSTIGNGNIAMPDFKPNGQKTRSFINRLQFGGNLQTVKSNYFFPATSDIAFSVGYNLNDKSTIGIGGSYKMGWGRDIRHVSISNQGFGIRSFIDYKIRGSLSISGGLEMNYRSQFNSFEVLNNYSPWQKSGLLGLSKTYKVTNKIKGNIQLMYDFLNKQQVPGTPPLIFRVGYLLQ